jgi:ABC-2 type transport system permease protein
MKGQALAAIYFYFQRDLLRWVRGRVTVFSSLVMPAAWLVFVGLALPIRFTDNYLDFITPGIIVMTMLTASLQGGTLLMFDKILGFLNKFLALPAPREAILFGKIAFITFRGLVQGTVILVLSLVLGATVLKLSDYAAIYLILALFGVFFSCCATTLALHLDDHDSYAAVNTMVSMPIFFTSSALMPYAVMPAWLAAIAHLNPLSWAIDAIRAIGLGVLPVTQILVLLGMTGVVLAVSVRAFRRVTV